MKLVPPHVWATLTIWQEARGEPFPGMVAVAEVIRNRAFAKYNSDGTIAGTVLRAKQFSGWNSTDGNRIPAALLDGDDPVVLACARAWDVAVDGSETVKGAVLYCNLAIVVPEWVHHVRQVAVVGRHTFFVDP